jgi:hypothetical protein
VKLSSVLVVLIACLGLTALTGLGESAGAQSLTHRWSQYYGDADNQNARAVATDADGNIIIAGEFMTWINLGGGSMLSEGGYDIFLAKFDSDGHHIWSEQFGDASSQYVSGLAVTSSGDILLCGSFFGSVNFGGFTHTSAGGQDAYVAKFTPGGARIWSGSYGDASEQICRSVAVGNGGKTYLIGYFAGTIDLGGGPLTSAGSYDVWLAELDGSSGSHIWSRRFGDASPQIGWGVDVTAQGAVAIIGHAQGSIDFGGGSLMCAGGYDMFVARFSAGGVHQWSHLYGDSDSQTGIGVRIDDATNEISVLGQFSGAIDLGGGPLVSAGNTDICLARLTATGAHTWSRRFGGTHPEYPRGIDVTPEGAIATTGFFEGTCDFGGGPLTSAGDKDIFIATYDDDGSHVTSQRFGDDTTQVAQSIAFDPDGDLVNVGGFMGTVNFGGNPLTSYGLMDAYLVKFSDWSAVPGAPADPVLAPGLGPALAANPFALRITPSPAASGATLNYTLPEAGPVRVRVFDAEGRCLYTLADEWQAAGEQALPWGAGARADASAGRVRFVQLDAGGRSATLRAIEVE